MEEKDQKNGTNVTQIVLIGLLIIAAFFIGMLWTKVRDMDTTGGSAGNTGSAVPADKAGTGANPTAPKIESAKNLDPVTKEDFVRGNRNARYALVEYSDYECPFCKRFHETAKQFLSANSDNVMWVYRHFPLDQLHPNTRRKSEAAECVAKLGGNDKFWEFTDEMYANQSMSLDDLTGVVKKLGINESAFKSCYDKNETKGLVDADAQSGSKAGVTGTPGNILLDTKTGKTVVVPGAQPLTQLQYFFSALTTE